MQIGSRNWRWHKITLNWPGIIWLWASVQILTKNIIYVTFFNKQNVLNPLTLGTFCKKCVFWTFWWFLGWISAKLPLIQLKRRLQHSSLPFLPPASHFSAFWLGHAQKSKFWQCLDEKVTYVFRLFDFWNFFWPFLFLLFSSSLLQWLTFYWVCLQLKKLLRKCHRDGQFLAWSSQV